MEPTAGTNPELTAFYEAEARKYMRSLRPEHFMEAMPQATQRKITLESFDVIHAKRPEVQCFNELLIQYRRGKRKKLCKVVPDNFVVIHPQPIVSLTNFSLEEQSARPLLVLEYVSKHSERKDYDDNYEKYEEELKVPYYLVFYPDNEEVTLFRLGENGYAAASPNAAGRYAIPELELEAGLLGEWLRFWFRGELLPLPGDLLIERDAAREQRDEERTARKAAEKKAKAAEARATAAEAEIAKLREELAKAKGQP
ncbi:MAG: Uma2 family endonuclease [Planctomycetes bacterium]|nr:Uma2 family endonuclease [Planctomycetota bacterium]